MKRFPSQTLVLPLIIAYFLVFILTFGLSLQYVLFIIGGVLGVSFFWWEVLFYLYTRPSHTQEKKLLISLMKEKRFQEAGMTLQAESQKIPLISQSLLFVGIYLIMAFFVITSTGSALGVGMILGLGVKYCTDIFAFREKESELQRIYTQFGNFEVTKNLFSQLKKVYLALFILLSVLVLL